MSFFYVIKSNKTKCIMGLCVLFLIMGTILLWSWFHGEKKNEMQHFFYSYSTDNNSYRVLSEQPEEAVRKTWDEKNPIENLYAKSALLMDQENGRILFEKNGYEKVPMASTTKIMTLLIVLENANLEDIVTVSSNAAAQPDVQLGIKKDEQYRLKDLLYSLMLESHNDTAVAIAEHVGGSVEGFAKLMNEKAKELGADETNFVTPNGLDAKEHYTTARDLALITRYALENETFCEIIKTTDYSFHEQTTGRSFYVANKNRFLNMYDGAIGVKTGFTGKAGYCFVGAIKREGMELISVVFASGWPPHKSYKWEDTKKLMDYGTQNYTQKRIVESQIAFQPVPVENGIDCKKIVPQTNQNVELLLKEGEEITYDVKLPSFVEAPVKKGQKIGSLEIKIDGETYKVIPLLADNGCREVTFTYEFKQILYKFLYVPLSIKKEILIF